MRSKPVLFALVFVAVVLALAFTIGIFMPGKWRAQASATIRAPAASIQPLLADVHRWPEWFPWTTAKDPGLTYSFSGPPSGVGAVLQWHSQKVGEGTLTLTRSDAAGVAYDLVLRGSDQPSHGEIALVPTGDSTVVTWSDGGELGRNPIARLFRGVIEQMLSQEFATSLAQLEKLVAIPADGVPSGSGKKP